MATPIKLKILTQQDDKLAPVTDAQVVVGRRDLVGDSEYPYDDLLATFQHVSDGHYVNASGDPENEPGVGEWLIVVRKSGFSLVAQKLTITAKDGVLRAAPGWKEPGVTPGLAACVSIVNFDQATGQSTAAKQSLLTVQLFPAQRYVGVGCRDNHGGTRFTLFAAGRRDFLRDSGELNAGCIATLFDCLNNVILTTVKGSRASSKDWFVVHSVAPSQEKVSVVDFYAFMHRLGTDEPGTVVEAGLFGHAWHQGPIVQGSFDQSPKLDLRDPDDQDGRPKDWYPNGEVATTHPNLKQAFASGGRLLVWGCSHMINVVAEAAECNKQAAAGTPRDRFFPVVLTDGGRLNTTLDHAKASIAANVTSVRNGRFPEHGSASGKCTYGGVMARALAPEVECFVAMPGAGANFGSVKGPARKGAGSTSHIAMLIIDEGENAQLERYYEREFGADFQRNALRYMSYTKFLNASLPDPGYSTLRFARYFYQELDANILRLPSRLEVARIAKTGNFEAPIPFSRDGEQGHLYVAKRAVVLGLRIRAAESMVGLDQDASQDVGFFVTQSGKTIVFERAAGSKDFVPPKQPLRVFQAVMVFDPHFGIVEGDPGTPLPNNVIESVTPRFFW
jgi:hypothetical protein